VTTGLYIIGHRGACGYEPENTIRSLRKAINLGVDAVEIDVRLTKDNKLAVIHDTTLDRTTNGKGLVRNYTLEELKKFDAGKGEHIPSLSEVIDFVRNKVELVIEIKDLGSESLVASAVLDEGVADSVMVTSFHPSSVLKIKELLPKIKTGVIFSSEPIRAYELALHTKANAILPRIDRLSKTMVKQAQEHNVLVYTWVVNNKAEFFKALDLGVDGVASDFPDVLIR
jgi:glycerophosphoryl diester phosphodiesterase